MSAAVSHQRPNWRPQGVQPSRQQSPQPQQRHIEIVTTRAQRTARPKSFYAGLSVATMFALLIGQLLMSIVLSDGAYQISSLQGEQSQLLLTEESLSEQLDLLASPQSLAMKAESLGMVTGSSAPAFLLLSDGSVIGNPVAASGNRGLLGADGGFVAHFLLSNLQQPVSSPPAAETEGAPSQPTASGSVPSGSGALPSPSTR